MSGFTQKLLSFTFALQSTTFANGTDTLKLSGLRAEFSMLEAGGVSRTEVHIAIYGMTASQMNSLSTYGMPPSQNQNNSVSVEAGDTVNGLSLLFQGSIFAAWADYSSQPDVKFVIEAYMGGFLAVKPASALSFNGPAAAATIMGNIASQMGLGLENTGVTAQLTNSYFPGSLDDKRKACAQAANINSLVDTVRNVLAIWPKGQARGGQVLVVSPTTGLIGYPTFTIIGVEFNCLWNPNIVFGRKLQLQSSLKPACGLWIPSNVRTTLATEIPDGPWMMHVEAYNTGAFVGN
jgi:hypothetical protein